MHCHSLRLKLPKLPCSYEPHKNSCAKVHKASEKLCTKVISTIPSDNLESDRFRDCNVSLGRPIHGLGDLHVVGSTRTMHVIESADGRSTTPITSDVTGPTT